MTNYPNGLDDIVTLPTVSGSDPEPTAINALRDACFAIEKELGLTPSGIYSDVRVRLDILESRINFGVNPSIPNDGYVLSPLYIWNVPSNVTLSISDGYGVPTENRLNGSLYMRADGYVNQDLYIRRDGYWVPIQTQPWVADGDLTGTDTSQTVIGWYNKPLKSTMELVGAIQDGYHPTWNNADGYWEAQTGFIPGRDLGQFSGPYGRTGQTVIGIWNRNVSSAAPSGTTASDGDSLAWDTTVSQWQPRPRAIIFDGYTGRTNIRSHKIFQSPIDTSKIGIINFGSRSSGATTGATADYAAILSGDRNTASGNYSLVVGGDSHTASGQFSTVINGAGNSATQQYAVSISGTLNVASAISAFIGNGSSNIASALQSAVLDGYSNTAGGTNSVILNGGNNQSLGIYSTILNGGNNTISSTSPHTLIGGGTNNLITNFANYSVIVNGNGNTSNAANTFIGSATDGYVKSIYSVIVSGLTNTINTGSSYSAIVTGQTNTINVSSLFGFIGTGNGNSATGNYATILNSTAAIANGLHSLILNGNTNSATGNYVTIVNGNNNTISGSVSHATIIDGYNHSVTGTGSWIGDGYNNTVSGIFSSILNGNFNTVAGRNSTVLNGANNNIDANSPENVVLLGNGNSLVTTNNALVVGTGNTLTNVSNHFVLGALNNSQSTFSFINGSLNILGTGTSFNRVFGSSNVLANGTTANFISGSNNNIDGYGNSSIFGSRNLMNANASVILGSYGRSRLNGQLVQSSFNFTGNNAGEAQFSRVILVGSGAAGAAFSALVPGDGYLTFTDGYAYDINVRVLIVNNQPQVPPAVGPDPTRPARFVYELLASQEAGTLTIHDQNNTLINQNGTGWSVSISAVANQLVINVDQATFPTSPVPFNSSNRRAIVTVEWREITRV